MPRFKMHDYAGEGLVLGYDGESPLTETGLIVKITSDDWLYGNYGIAKGTARGSHVFNSFEFVYFYTFDYVTVTSMTFTWGGREVFEVSNARLRDYQFNHGEKSLLRGYDLIIGNRYADRVRAFDGDDSIHGLDGDDTLLGVDGNDELNGGSGDDLLMGDDSNDLLKGDSGNDRMLGGNDYDLLKGGSGDDRLAGGSGRDTLAGGTGNDTLTGGRDDDRFVFAKDGGRDSVTDYTDGRDMIVIKTDVASFAGLTILNRGPDVLIKAGGVQVLLENVDHRLIDASDFLFS